MEASNAACPQKRRYSPRDRARSVLTLVSPDASLPNLPPVVLVHPFCKFFGALRPIHGRDESHQCGPTYDEAKKLPQLQHFVSFTLSLELISLLQLPAALIGAGHRFVHLNWMMSVPDRYWALDQ